MNLTDAETDREQSKADQGPSTTSPARTPGSSRLRLGREVRFLLVAVGGAAVRVVRSAQAHGLRYQETVAINGDERVQEAMDFDLRVCLKSPWEGNDPDPGSLSEGRLALVPALETLFERVTFVTLVGSLGGETGSSVLPAVLEAAGRHASFLSVFLVKPFACEQERRDLAEASLSQLKQNPTLRGLQRQQRASLFVLDNERAVPLLRTQPLRALTGGYGQTVADHILERYIQPAEGVLRDFRLLNEARLLSPETAVPLDTPAAPGPLEHLPGAFPALPVAASPPEAPTGLELLLEVAPPEPMGPAR